jgi:hypothetical protein
MGKRRNGYMILVGKLEGTTKKINTYVRQKGWVVWSRLVWLRIGTIGGLL